MMNEMERNELMGGRLQRLRNQNSLTQEELAERLDVSRQSVSKWELNKTLPDVDKLIQLSEIYQVSIDYLIKGEEVKEEGKKEEGVAELAGKEDVAGKASDLVKEDEETDKRKEDNETDKREEEDRMREEKRMSKETKIILGSMIILIIILIALVGILLPIKGDNKQGESGNSEPIAMDEDKKTTTEESTSDIFDTEVEKEGTEAANGIKIVIDGFQFHVPADYSCFYAEGVGPVVYLDDVFQMKLGVRDNSYEESMKAPEVLMSKTIEAGGKILQDIKETELDGKKYAYFLMELSGDKCFVGFTQAADTDRRFGGQIVIQSDNLTDEDLLHIFADITSTAKITDEPDSTKDDIVNQSANRNLSDMEGKKE